MEDMAKNELFGMNMASLAHRSKIFLMKRCDWLIEMELNKKLVELVNTFEKVL